MNSLRVAFIIFPFQSLADDSCNLSPQRNHFPAFGLLLFNIYDIYNENAEQVHAFMTQLLNTITTPFSSMSIFFILRRLRILIATLCPVRQCSAIFTLPNEPIPSVFPS